MSGVSSSRNTRWRRFVLYTVLIQIGASITGGFAAADLLDDLPSRNELSGTVELYLASGAFAKWWTVGGVATFAITRQLITEVELRIGRPVFWKLREVVRMRRNHSRRELFLLGMIRPASILLFLSAGLWIGVAVDGRN